MTARAARAVSLGHRLRRLTTGLVALLVVVGCTGAGALVLMGQRIEQLSRHLTPAVELATEVEHLTDGAQAAVVAYESTDEESVLAPYRDAGPRLAPVLEELRARLDGFPELGPAVAEQERAAQAWLGPDGSAHPHEPGSVDRLAELQRANAALEEVLRAEREDVRALTRELRAYGLTGLGLVTLATVVACAVVARRAVAWLEGPSDRLRAVLERLRMGQHDARADDQAGPTELRVVARAVNHLADESDRMREAQSEAARLRRLTADVSRGLRDELESEDVLRVTLEQLCPGLDVDRAWVEVLAAGGGPGRVVSWQRPGLPEVDLVPFAGDDSLRLARRLWRDGHVLVTSEPDREPALETPAGHALLSATSARSLLAAPVGGADDVVAVLTLVRVQGREGFGPDVVAAVQAVCADLGRALELAGLWAAQKELVDRLQDLDRRKTEFLSTVSHELRTPLTSIAGYLELIRDGDAGAVPPEMDAMLGVVARNATRLASLIEDILLLSRIESGAVRSSWSDVQVGWLLAAAAETVRPAVGDGGLTMEVREPARPLLVRGDAGQLERVLLNLASNAVKFTPRGGRVVLAVEHEETAEGGWAVLRCSDTGIGIPAEEHGELFSRFFRASNATAAAVPGTGLGLAIVRTVVERHGGSLALDSAPGRGTTVEVRLPLAGSAASPPDGGVPAGSADAGGEVARNIVAAAAVSS